MSISEVKFVFESEDRSGLVRFVLKSEVRFVFKSEVRLGSTIRGFERDLYHVAIDDHPCNTGINAANRRCFSVRHPARMFSRKRPSAPPFAVDGTR